MRAYRQAGLVMTDHVFEVPLDHAMPGGRQIEVFAREVVSAEQAVTGRAADLPWLLYLQGGPGRPGPRPDGPVSWLSRALRDYRVVLLDQRGTGRSTPANRLTLASLASPRDQASYLTMFRADSIVADAELIRKRLAGGRPWSLLGQSFGGFCVLSYLSAAPEGVAEAFITGGLPGLDTTADDVYRVTYPLVQARNQAHYARFPQDVQRARDIARHLAAADVRLPSGAPLTVEAFQSLGLHLGMAAGSSTLHYLLEDAFDGGQISDAFRYRAEALLSHAGGPLYAVLHEACYARGQATRWAAHRVRQEFPAFGAQAAIEGSEPLLFTGEMIYPWMFEQDPVLRPLAEAAGIIADHEGWPALYDNARLAASEVPAAAAIYYDDMYVPQQFSVRTAAGVGRLRRWVTSEYGHDGLRVSDGAVLGRLIDMARGIG